MSSTHRHTPPGTHEHEYEPQHGLPERLPLNEHLLWQGSPGSWALARDAFHLRGLAVYFAALLSVRAWFVWAETGSAADTAVAVAWLLPMVGFVLAVVVAAAIASARLAVYTITTRRVVMRIGIVLTVTYNFPFKQLRGAGVHLRKGGSGDIALTLAPNTQTTYAHLWPHARPWHVLKPQPLLRGLSDAKAVATVLTEAWLAFQQSQAMPQVAPGQIAQPQALQRTHSPAEQLASPHLAGVSG